MKTQEEKVEYLKELIQKCHDSNKGYEQAADAAKSQSMKLLFHNTAMERKDFAHDLNGLVMKLGGSITDSGSFKGTLHRNWLNVKALLSAETEESILEECQRGDQVLIEDYMETIQKAELVSENEAVLARQLGNVQSRVARLEMIEEEVH